MLGAAVEHERDNASRAEVIEDPDGPAGEGLSLDELAQQAAVLDADAPERVFRRMSFDDVLKLPPKEWIVRDLIGKRDKVMIHGDAKAGKSLVALDLMAAIVRGDDFAGEFKIKIPANCVYATGEGRSGLRNRAEALENKWKLTAEERARMDWYDDVPQLSDDAEISNGIRRFVDEYKAECGDKLRGGVLFIDTWATATRGRDENTSVDTTEIFAAMDYAIEQLGCTIIVIHHKNKAGGVRGSTNIPASLDAVIEVRKEADGRRFLSCNTAKDSECVPDIEFRLGVHRWIENLMGDDEEEHTGGDVEWVGKRSEQATKRDSTDGGIIETLEAIAPDKAHAKPLGGIHDALQVPMNKSNLSKALKRLMESKHSEIKGEIRKVLEGRGTSNREVWHYWYEGPAR